MKVSTEVAGCTLLGVTTQTYPILGGNCFDLLDAAGEEHRVVNFYLENFEEITKRLGMTDVEVKLLPKSDGLWLIADDRIPAEWYSDHYCAVCCSRWNSARPDEEDDLVAAGVD